MKPFSSRFPVLVFLAAGSLLNAQERDVEILSLDNAITAALANNYGYRIASLDPEIARQSLAAAESAFDPELFASGRLSQTEQSTTFTQTTGTETDNRSWQAGIRKRFAYGTTITARTNLDRLASNAGVVTSNLSQDADISLSLTQPLLKGFGRDANLAGIESATAGLSASRQALRDSLFTLLAATEEAYWTAARLQEQLSLNESSLKVAESLLEEARERERVGVATRIEVLQAEASRAQRLEEIITSRRSLGDAMDNLYRAMGVLPPSPDADDQARVESLSAEARSIPRFDAAWEQALAADPALARQEALIAQREWDRRSAKANVKPSLDLFLTGGYLGVDDKDASEAYNKVLDRDGHAWTVGVEFSMPWQLRGEKAALRSAEKRLEQETLRYEDLKRALYQEVRSAWRNLDAVAQSVEAASLTVSLREATFEREKGKYEEGISVFRDVLEAQSDLDQAKIRLLQAKFERLAAEIALARLTGAIAERHGLASSALLPD